VILLGNGQTKRCKSKKRLVAVGVTFITARLYHIEDICNRIATNKQNINILQQVAISDALPLEAACPATPLIGFNHIHKACITHEPINFQQN